MSDRSAVTILTEYFRPEEASTAQLVTDLATGLQGEFDVSVVTARPNYHGSDVERPAPATETLAGVDVRRVRATRFDKDALPLRVLNWLSFAVLVFARLVRTRDERDAVLALSNPPILPVVTLLLKRLTGTPYAYLVYDMYPDMPVALGYISEDGLVARVWRRTMQAVYRDADVIVVLGDAMRRRLLETLGDDPEFDRSKVETIPNWADGSVLRPRPKDGNEFAAEHGTQEPFTLVYSGNVGRFHELRTAVDAVGRLERRGRTDVQLLVIGEGARKSDLRAYVDEAGIEGVRFLPFQPRDRLPETLTCGDASLVGVRPEVAGMCVSSKLYSSLAVGRPVLAVVGEDDEVARVVGSCTCGAHVEPGDAAAAADALERWADDAALRDRLGENARQCFEDRYTLDHALDRYGDLFETLMASDAADGAS